MERTTRDVLTGFGIFIFLIVWVLNYQYNMSIFLRSLSPREFDNPGVGWEIYSYRMPYNSSTTNCDLRVTHGSNHDSKTTKR